MDAQRNRGRILEVANNLFNRFGADASLDDIAKQAGVGAGTLYLGHFPTREVLIEAGLLERGGKTGKAAESSGFSKTSLPSRPCEHGRHRSSTTSRPSRLSPWH